MERQSISLIGFSVFFGVLVGFSILLSAFYANGSFSEDSPAAERIPTGMELLQTFQCDKAETKQVLVGGAEDNFDPAGVEPSNPSERLIRYLVDAEEGRTPSDISKTYDETTQDTAFSDRFNIPARTFDGLVVVRVKELSGLKNDGLSLGYKIGDTFPYINYEYGYRIDISNLPGATEWEDYGSLFSASLKDLRISAPASLSNAKLSSLLELIRTRGEIDPNFFVEIADDTAVDFIGFALCLEPEENKGFVMNRYHPTNQNVITDFGPGIVGLHAAKVNGNICSYGGCLSCNAKRPLVCIDDKNIPLPESNGPEFRPSWSGGDFKFTKAVEGSEFSTEDEVDQFCTNEFGPKWRALSRHDGAWTGVISGTGTFPTGYENVWVNVKNSDHFNCWKTRPDYEVVNGG